MCNDDKSALLLEEANSSAAAPPPKGKGKTAKVRSGRQGVAVGRHKLSPWTGVRFWRSGNWATEIRAPHTRQKVWIGTFKTPRQAALAYDAAVFCLFGEHPPKARKINFPAAPRPEISETARFQLSVAEMKAVAGKHAYDVDALLPPLPDADDSTAAPGGLVVAAPATPVAVEASSAGAGGPAALPDSLSLGDADLDHLIRTFDINAFQAETDPLTFIVSDDEYNELYA